MKVVVTGGAGFIGANTCRLLAEHNIEAVALDDLSSGFRSNLEGIGATLVEGSILDDTALDEVLPGADAVIHLAARPSVPRSIADPWSAHEVNATGTVKVLEAVRRHDVGQVVVASSSSVYGANPTLPKQEDLTLRPVSPYAASKLATETYTLAWGSSYGIKTLAFRFFNVFGPLQPAGHAYAAVVPAFVDAALAGRPLPVNGDGSQSRDFTFVDSVASVLTRAVTDRTHSPLPVNLAFGTRTTLLELIGELETILGHPLEREHREPRAGDVPHSQADQTRFRSLFPDVEPTPLPEALARTVAWFRSTGAGAAT
ncbi:NAD-dependent epimerase/dehydratase family protein [Rhabdothermincola salaria]|uniref:NAD-dependent epimerase/dehydratase family protein n=1 Tax=Rhabdothermincola salaria TaxID=2903142 RepID=UPI001E5578A7|nr:NAD-dependent epimerase/dehydratase family protein [Rhabdothermincola salaria]MCD9622750.1 NAD-dependent epimerase/dehydratase family protein [Rhabdothermincola salaria]